MAESASSRFARLLTSLHIPEEHITEATAQVSAEEQAHAIEKWQMRAPDALECLQRVVVSSASKMGETLSEHIIRSFEVSMMSLSQDTFDGEEWAAAFDALAEHSMANFNTLHKHLGPRVGLLPFFFCYGVGSLLNPKPETL